MNISCLTNILPQPDCPEDTGVNELWPNVDGEIKFPKDYVAFINSYGIGRIAQFMAIFNPFTTNSDLNFFEQKRYIVEDLNSLIVEDPDYYKYKLYPEEGGLLPVGVTDNGDYIFWVVNNISNSDAWNTAIIAARSPDVEYFEENLTQLLTGILLGKIKEKSLPHDFPHVTIGFEKM